MDTHALGSPSPTLLDEVRHLREVCNADRDNTGPLWLWLFTVLVARLLTVLGALTAYLQRDPVYAMAELHHAAAMGGNARVVAQALGAMSSELANTRAELALAQDAYHALATEVDRPPGGTPFPDGSTIAEQWEEDERKRLETQAPPPPAPGPEPEAPPEGKPEALASPTPARRGSRPGRVGSRRG